MTGKIYVSMPESINSLEKQVVEDYSEASRNTKSREMLQLLQGGMVLKNMGLLQTSIALGLSDEMDPISGEASEAIKKAFLARLAGNMKRQNEDASDHRSSEPNVHLSDSPAQPNVTLSASLREPEQTKAAQVKVSPSPGVVKVDVPRSLESKTEGQKPIVRPAAMGSMMKSETGGGS